MGLPATPGLREVLGSSRCSPGALPPRALQRPHALCLQIDQPSLGMPSREYYFNEGTNRKVSPRGQVHRVRDGEGGARHGQPKPTVPPGSEAGSARPGPRRLPAPCVQGPAAEAHPRAS